MDTTCIYIIYAKGHQVGFWKSLVFTRPGKDKALPKTNLVSFGINYVNTSGIHTHPPPDNSITSRQKCMSWRCSLFSQSRKNAVTKTNKTQGPNHDLVDLCFYLILSDLLKVKKIAQVNLLTEIFAQRNWLKIP